MKISSGQHDDSRQTEVLSVNKKTIEKQAVESQTEHASQSDQTVEVNEISTEDLKQGTTESGKEDSPTSNNSKNSERTSSKQNDEADAKKDEEKSDIDKEIEAELLAYLDGKESKEEEPEKKKYKTVGFLVILVLAALAIMRFAKHLMFAAPFLPSMLGH
ncbi:hypothetical protein I6I28_05800 [Staphylococcus pettenkoferi]|uniref:hypothetical protein n=1 Tax=Staphylococcus pettenkoferi TaxID=170573 RepID=UPI0018E1C6BA|nr:hypothetical protein [Staphylococcus pettenkoferi]QQC38392.1 hypothetical protein I6I28_05800 [Staphylococcus pettenkoferi]